MALKLPDPASIGGAAVPRGVGVVNTTSAGAPTARAAALAGAAGEESADFGLEPAANALQQVATQIRSRDDTLARVKALGEFQRRQEDELLRLSTEGDFSDRETASQFIKGLSQNASNLLSAHTGSQESYGRLQADLARLSSAFETKAATMRIHAQQQMVERTVGGQMNNITNSVYNNPGSLADAYAQLDAVIDNMAPALTPEQEMDYRDIGRAQIGATAISSMIDQGMYQAAQDLMETTPGITDALSPEQQMGLRRKIAQFKNIERQAVIQARANLVGLKTMLGRNPTAAERARAAGVYQPPGPPSLSQKMERAEAALGRPLDTMERERLVMSELGLDEGGPMSPQAKVVEDRNRFVRMYGDDSPQVQAFDDLINSPEPPDQSTISGQRKEFTSLSKDFVAVRDAFARIQSSAQNASPAGDLALMFNYMKMLDPGSVVRESEFAQIAATGSMGQRLAAAAKSYLSGERLTEQQRDDFVGRANDLMRAQASNQLRLEGQYRGVAQRAGLDPSDVVVDFLGPYRDKMSAQPQPTASVAAPQAAEAGSMAQPQQTAQDAPVEAPKGLMFDMNGNLIGGQP